jgi:YgiT-type zinc finger domain-containing protein
MCDGTMVAATRSKALERDGSLAVVRAVPVLVCESCGEVYLDAAVARQLDVLFRRLLDGPVDQVVGHYEPSAE